MPKKSSGPAVSYIPEKPAASSSQTTTQAKPQGVPFWDQGKVQVEVLDMPAEKTPTPSTNTMVPPQSGTGSTQQSMSTSSSMSSSASSSTTSSSSGSSSSSSSPVVAVLLKQANNELSVGKADRAATTLERALRIAPDDANLWLRLAEVNEQLGNKTQASSMARKALDLAPDDAAIRLRAQRLVN
jgi:tetratricopeptide (TPR) repeat protein